MVEKQRRKDIADTRHSPEAVDQGAGSRSRSWRRGSRRRPLRTLKAYRDELKAVHDHGDLSPVSEEDEPVAAGRDHGRHGEGSTAGEDA
jgi:hypothetical protein